MPSWLLVLFQRLLELTGKVDDRRGLADPGGRRPRRGQVRPVPRAFRKVLGDPRVRLQETYPCSEGFIAFGDPATGLLRLCFDHGLFYEFVPVDELGSAQPTRHWLGNVQTGSQLRDRRLDLRGAVVARHRRHGPVRVAVAAAAHVHGPDEVHALGLRRAPDQRGDRGARWRSPSEATGASVRDWHVGPVFHGSLGHHLYRVRVPQASRRPAAFRDALDADLGRRNADYLAHRAEGRWAALPGLIVAKPGGFDAWMRSQGKLGGQHKVPRMDNTGALTSQVVVFLRESGLIAEILAAG